MSVLVLVVDDEPDMEALFRQQFRRDVRAGRFDLAFAAGGAQALEEIGAARGRDIILLLSDINMPGMDGYALTARIKATPGFAAVPIVAVTANVMRGDREKSLEAGCDGYIQKPIDTDILSQQIHRFLARQSND